MTENKIDIRSINSLLNERFRVPRYQRGYRWGEQEITELLEDIFEYAQRVYDKDNNRVGDFYCLQPIVVKKAEWKEMQGANEVTISGWDLIDGQQRLTTLFIILSYLDDFRKENYDEKTNKYSLTFETRDNCIAFLNEKGFSNEIDDSNVDFYHICKCYEYVKEWFKDKLTKRLEILKTILDQDKNVSVIWYEVDDKDENNPVDPIDIFTRLNIGKIPLTDSELIKALILQNDGYPTDEQRYVKQRLFEIASEWDRFEAVFRNDQFWCFISNDDQKNIGIEFIFNLLAKKWNAELPVKKKIKEEAKHFAYLVFNKYLELKQEENIKYRKEHPEEDRNLLQPINDIWKDVKDLFSIFDEWYNNHTIYHYIGYLMTMENSKIEKLIELSRKSNKEDFIAALKKRIGEKVDYKKQKDTPDELKTLSDYVYVKDNKIIISILLLFNIETIVQSFKKENTRFPFHLYKKDKITSIEHIHPQNPEDFSFDETRAKEWLKSHGLTLKKILNNNKELDKEQIEKCKELVEKVNIYDKEKFDEITQEVGAFYDNVSGMKEHEVHTLYNLALVDKDTNSALNNSPYDIKRNILKENKLGRYIPIGTQRAFEKYYSDAPVDMIFWGNEDRKAYFTAIEKVYKSFVDLTKI